MFGWLRLCGVVGVLALPMAAQTTVGTVPAHKVPRFSVSTVKPSKSDGYNAFFTTNGFRAKGMTLNQLAKEAYAAYGVGGFVGGPGWMNQKHYDVEARIDPDDVPDFERLSLPERYAMLQVLMKERFALVVHQERRMLPAFGIHVAPGGSKLQPAEEKIGGGEHEVSGYEGMVTLSLRGHLQVKDMDAQGICRVLQGSLGRNVVNETGLTGRYDFDLHWRPELTMGPPSLDSGATEADAWPALPVALKEQLGLRIESTTAPVEVTVVDAAQEPGAN